MDTRGPAGRTVEHTQPLADDIQSHAIQTTSTHTVRNTERGAHFSPIPW